MNLPIKAVVRQMLNFGKYLEASDFLRENRKNCTSEEYQECLQLLPKEIRGLKDSLKPRPDDKKIIAIYTDGKKDFMTKGAWRRLNQEKQHERLWRSLELRRLSKKSRDEKRAGEMVNAIMESIIAGNNEGAKQAYRQYKNFMAEELSIDPTLTYGEIVEQARMKQKQRELERKRQQEEQKRVDRLCKEALRRTDAQIELARTALRGHKYIGSEWRKKCLSEAGSDSGVFRGATNYADYEDKLTELRSLIDDDIAMHNAKILSDIKAEVGTIDGKTLDDQQLECVAIDTPNHLVVAGAGTGKTLTIVGKIKHLIKSGKCRPEEILVLSFTNRAVGELRQRVDKEVPGVDIFTFHGLGKRILQRSGRIVREVIDGENGTNRRSVNSIVRSALQEQDADYRKRVLKYIEDYKIQPKADLDFESQQEYDKYLSLNPPITLLGERVKSYGELTIANYLAEHRIKYEYESAYKPVETADEEHQNYRPDFYLPDYDLYLEYFAIDENGKAPEFFKPGYVDQMQWKRKLHRENGTTMLELYAYQNQDGSLLDYLEERLHKAGVRFELYSEDELWDMICNSRDSVLDTLCRQFGSIIGYIKGWRFSFEELRRKNMFVYGNSDFELKHNTELLDLVQPIYSYYQNTLTERNSIDFNDMIYLAIDAVKAGKYSNPYKYVIIDEYQDISEARIKLVTALRESNDFDLFCVGDDWQSIFRYAGSNLDQFLHFENYWGEAERSVIETTYRYPQRLADISGDFIMGNPKQIRKSMISKSKNADDTDVLDFITPYTDNVTAQLITYRLNDLPAHSGVVFLGRYNNDKFLLTNSGNSGLKTHYDNYSGLVSVSYSRNPSLKMQFMTVHKSKGLEFDYVFVLNNKDGVKGFPSKVGSDPIVRLFINDGDSQQDEERRLFYVALTRARKKVFLVVPNQPDDWRGKEVKESDFAKECRRLFGEAEDDDEEDEEIFF